MGITIMIIVIVIVIVIVTVIFHISIVIAIMICESVLTHIIMRTTYAAQAKEVIVQAFNHLQTHLSHRHSNDKH
jgi:hypothetical protein